MKFRENIKKMLEKLFFVFLRDPFTDLTRDRHNLKVGADM